VTLDPSEVGGGSDPGAIAETAQSEGLRMPGISADSAIAWPTRVIEVIRKWLPNGHRVAETRPVAFVLLPSIRASQGLTLDVLDVPSGRSLDPGSVYLCDEGMRQARRPRDPAPTVDQWAADLRSAGGAVLPTLVYSPADRGLLQWYPNGIDGPGTFERKIEIGIGKSMSETELIAELDLLHAAWWASPSSPGVSLWSNRRKGIPVPNTERVFQDQVCLWCTASFRDHLVQVEVAGSGGRCDLFIIPRSPGAVGRGLVEMKVLRAFHFPESGGSPISVTPRENEAAVKEGLRQAHVYGTKRRCDVSLLCLCDMRKQDSNDIVVAFSPTASQLEVAIRRYFVFASDKAYRVALTKTVLPE
jgi:hypothetical protein